MVRLLAVKNVGTEAGDLVYMMGMIVLSISIMSVFIFACASGKKRRKKKRKGGDGGGGGGDCGDCGCIGGGCSGGGDGGGGCGGGGGGCWLGVLFVRTG